MSSCSFSSFLVVTFFIDTFPSFPSILQGRVSPQAPSRCRHFTQYRPLPTAFHTTQIPRLNHVSTSSRFSAIECINAILRLNLLPLLQQSPRHQSRLSLTSSITGPHSLHSSFFCTLPNQAIDQPSPPQRSMISFPRLFLVTTTSY